MCSKPLYSLYSRGIHSCLYCLQNRILDHKKGKRWKTCTTKRATRNLCPQSVLCCESENFMALGLCANCSLLTVQQTTRLLFGNLKWDHISKSFKKFWQRLIKDGFWWPANTYISFIPCFQNLWDHSAPKSEKTNQQQWPCISVHSSNLKIYPQRFNLLVF